MTSAESEEVRRHNLRALLFQCRSLLKPGDVGLPQTGRRRVAGLRREDVAELAGVSTDWYASFESGRAVRVSVQFLARLAAALRLTRAEKRALFNLAIPELYEMRTIHRLRWAHSKAVSLLGPRLLRFLPKAAREPAPLPAARVS